MNEYSYSPRINEKTIPAKKFVLLPLQEITQGVCDYSLKY